MLGRKVWICAFSLLFCSPLFAQSTVELKDFGKTSGLGIWGNYMLHFKVAADNYPIDSVWLSFGEEDTFLRADSRGEYRLEVYLRWDSMKYLYIGNAPYYDDGKLWKTGHAWTQTQTVYMDEAPIRPINVLVPEYFPKPRYSLFHSLAIRDTTERNLTLQEVYGLERPYEGKSGMGCDRSEASEYDFPFTFAVENCDGQIILEYGVSSTKYPTELSWAKELTKNFKAAMADYYLENVDVAGFDTEKYKYNYQGRTYLLYLVEDESCIMDGYECYMTRIYVKWA